MRHSFYTLFKNRVMGLLKNRNNTRVNQMLSDAVLAREVMKSIMLTGTHDLNRVVVKGKKNNITDLTVDGKKLKVTELG